MERIAIVITTTLFAARVLTGLAVAQTPDKWAGAYVNRASGVALEIKPRKEGMYAGEFTYNGVKLPIRGLPILGIFTAEYQYQQQWFSFTLTRGAKQFSLAVDGVTVPMDRLPAGAKLPVAKGPLAPKGGSNPPAGGAAGVGGRANAGWTQRLAGRQLLFLQTGGGGTSKATLDLYANGRFRFASSSSYSSGGFSEFSYADQDSDDGTWKVVDRGGMTVLVTVSSKGGKTAEMRVQPGQTATQVLLNGKRFFIRALP